MPKLLDLFCGAGGAAMGYSRAGFDVVGVDINPQPNYPFEFIQDDALELLSVDDRLLNSADVIHASPPCQSFTVYRNARPGAEPRWPDLIDPTRRLLKDSGRPWVMENVIGAPLLAPIQLCGTSFGWEVRRHRLFESSMVLFQLPCAHNRFTERKYPGSSNRPNGRTVCNVGEYRVPLVKQLEAMHVDWKMTLHELSESIPWCYTEFIGTQLLAQIGV
jgi:DNA (cytosine-5)-methyltransferase 1